jgi:methanethiol S-methyltransferase
MAPMSKLLALVFGVVVYGLFGVTWAYFVGFVGGVIVPRSVDTGPVAPLATALALDLGCLALFFAHHSVMARARAKHLISPYVPPAVERSTYVLVSSLALGLVMAMWRPLPYVVWHAAGAVRILALAVFGAGVLLALVASHILDGLALFGVRQVLAHFRGRALPTTRFRTPGPYRLVRHPLMTGILMMLWGAPTMTAGHLLLAVVMSGYILAAVKWLEERDLAKALGARYARYQREVPMLLPLKAPRRGSAEAPVHEEA